MDFITREQARLNLVQLGLPQIVLDAFDEKPLPYYLDIQFHEPYQIFALSADGQAEYATGHITPIWTGGGDYTIVAFQHGNDQKGFFRFGIESPQEAPFDHSLNWQQILVKEFKDLWELEWTDERLREVAGWFEFRFIDQLIEGLSTSQLDSTEKDTEWYLAFIAMVGRVTSDD